MSKNLLKKALRLNKVTAVYNRTKNRGEKNEVKTYDLYMQKG